MKGGDNMTCKCIMKFKNEWSAIKFFNELDCTLEPEIETYVDSLNVAYWVVWFIPATLKRKVRKTK